MSMVDFVVDHLWSGKIVVDGIDSCGGTGGVNESYADEDRNSDPSGTEGAVKVLACFHMSPEFRSVGVSRVPAGKKACNVPEVRDTAKSGFDVFGKTAVVQTESAAVTCS